MWNEIAFSSSLVNGSTHEIGHDYTQYYTQHLHPEVEQVLEAAKRNEIRPRIQYTTMDMGPLWREARDSLDARIELHNRLGASTRLPAAGFDWSPARLVVEKGGKSSAFVLTVIIAFLYYMGLVTLIGLCPAGHPAGR